MDAIITGKDGQVITHFMTTNEKKDIKKVKNSGKLYNILDEILYNKIKE